MIRFSTLLIYMLFAISFMHAQKESDEDPLYARVGFKGGINYSNILGDIDDSGSRTRVHLGVIGEYPVTAKFFVQGELLYSAQGYTLDTDEEEKIGLNYISFPLLAKFYLIPTISLETGPQFSLLSTTSNSRNLENNDPFFNSFKETDISWGIGAGYWSESGLFFQLRYTIGISNISATDMTNRNSVVHASIGYLFKTKNNRRIIQQEE